MPAARAEIEDAKVTAPDQFKPGQRVRVLDCPTHGGMIGEVLISDHGQVRVGFSTTTPCWPRRVELVADDELSKEVS